MPSQYQNHGPFLVTPIPDERKAPHQSAGKPDVEKLAVEPGERQGDLPLNQRRLQPTQRSRNVLLNLRTGWIADNETGSGKKHRSPAKLGLALQGNLKFIAAEWGRLLASIPRALASVVRELLDAIGERAKDAATGAPGMVALFVVVVVIGAAAYVTTVQHIFARGALSDAPRTDLPAASGRGSSAPEQPTTLTSEKGGDPTSGLSEWALRGLDQAVAHSGRPAGTLPNPEALANLAGGRSKLEAAAPPFDFGSVLDWADFRTARGTAPRAYANPIPAGDGGRAEADALPSASDQGPHAASYREVSQAGQGMLKSPARAVARPLSAAAQATDNGRLFALEVAQVRAANDGGKDDVESTALDAIAHGGNAIFLLQHQDALATVLHPARIVLTATTLEFVPEGPCETGAFTIVLASITSVQVERRGAEMAHSGPLTIEFINRGEFGMTGSLRLRDPSSELLNAAQSSSQPGATHETDLLTHIRNVILAVQSR